MDYDKIAKDYLNAVLNHIGKKYNQSPSVFTLCGDVNGKRVLDVGCGSGYYSELFKKKGALKVVGIDVSEKQIQLARQRADSQDFGIEYIVGDAFNYDFSKLGKFDIAIAVFSLFYADSVGGLENVLLSIKKALDVDGILVALVENPENPLIEDERVRYGTRITSEKERLVDGDKLKVELFDADSKKACEFFSNYYSRESYEKSLRKAGFKEISWHKPVVSGEGVKKYGTDFWNAMKDNPTFMCVRAR